jgi:hypothetical protein
MGGGVKTGSEHLSDMLVRPPAARLRRFVQTERADHALRKKKRRSSPETLDAAIKAFERAVVASTPGDGDYERCMGNLASYLRERFALAKDRADLEAAIQCARQALDASPLLGEHRPWLMGLLAMSLRDRHEYSHDPADLEGAVLFARASARATPRRRHDDTRRRWGLVDRYAYAKYQETGHSADLDAAIDAARRALDATRRGDANRARRLAELAYDLVARYERAGRPGDLAAAARAAQEAVALSPADAGDRARCLGTLALARECEFDRSGSPADLDGAVEAAHLAVAALPEGDSDRAEWAARLSSLLVRDYEVGGVPARLDEALAAVNEALALIDADDTDRLTVLTNRAMIHLRSYEHSGDRERLDAAMADTDAAIADGRLTHGGAAQAAMIAGAVKCKYYEITGDEHALDEAIDATRAALGILAPAHRFRSLCLTNLGLCLGRRYERSGDPADLDDAIEAFRQAEAATSMASGRWIWRNDLCAYLRIRFERNRDESDIDLAVDLGRRTVEELDPGSPYRAMFLSNLGASLLARHSYSERAEDLDDAVAAESMAVSAVGPGHPDRPMYLMNLGLTLNQRFHRTGGQLADAREAVRNCREAVEATPPAHASRAQFLSNVSACLDSLAYETEEQEMIAAAIQAGEDALAAGGRDHPEHARHLLVLGDALLTRYLVQDDHDALAATFDRWREALSVQAASPQLRLSIAQRLGRRAARSGHLDVAVDAFASAIATLPAVIWHGLPPAVRQEQAARWAGLAAEAASCAIQRGRAELAVELLEQGRSLFWSQALNLRADLGDLALAAPDLASRLEAARRVMNAPAVPQDGPGDAVLLGARLARQESSDGVARAAREYDKALRQARTMPGFERYLDTTPYPELASAAEGGTIVIVNASQYGCAAIVVTPGADHPRVVNLPRLDLESTADRADQLARVIEQFQGQRRPFLDREESRHALLDILAWLWETIAEPVLEDLEATPGTQPSPVAPGYADPPRIWWCPTGPLVSLPLHAAGYYPRHRTQGNGDGATVPDRTVSSYVPTLAALRRAQGFLPPARIRHLTVAAPRVDRAGLRHELRNVDTELQCLARNFPPGNGNDQLVGELATRESMLTQMTGHDWIHVACHAGPLPAYQHQSRQLNHGFALWDDDLTIADLAAQPKRHGGLAFLSACQTASPNAGHRDEALHLAGAMQFLGYSHVVATMWSIADRPAPQAADTFYETLAKRGPDHAAHALRSAVLKLRDEDPTNPFIWAPYVHIGR